MTITQSEVEYGYNRCGKCTRVVALTDNHCPWCGAIPVREGTIINDCSDYFTVGIYEIDTYSNRIEAVPIVSAPITAVPNAGPGQKMKGCP